MSILSSLPEHTRLEPWRQQGNLKNKLWPFYSNIHWWCVHTVCISLKTLCQICSKYCNLQGFSETFWKAALHLCRSCLQWSATSAIGISTDLSGVCCNADCAEVALHIKWGLILSWSFDCRIKTYAAVKSLQLSLQQKCMLMSDYPEMTGFTGTPDCAELTCSKIRWLLLFWMRYKTFIKSFNL